LLLGASTMQKCDWKFPTKQSHGRDEATEGFHTFVLAISRLGVITQKLEQDAVEDYVGSITQEISELWPKVLCFLASMCVERRLLVSKIKFVVLKLSEISPSFRFAAEDAQIHTSIESAADAIRLNPRSGSKDRQESGGSASASTAGALEKASSAPQLERREPAESEAHVSVASMRKQLLEAHRRKSRMEEEPILQTCTEPDPPSGWVALLCGSARKPKNYLSPREEPMEEAQDAWVPDDDVRECTGCQGKFGFFRRKYHCGACGLTFCSKCTNHRVYYTLESRVRKDDHEVKETRACAACYSRISDGTASEANSILSFSSNAPHGRPAAA